METKGIDRDAIRQHPEQIEHDHKLSELYELLKSQSDFNKSVDVEIDSLLGRTEEGHLAQGEYEFETQTKADQDQEKNKDKSAKLDPPLEIKSL